MHLRILITTMVILTLAGQTAYSQACSCGGAPLLSSLESSSAPVGAWQFGLTYEYSSIGDVFSGTTNLNDDTRRRSVHSALLEIGYGISSRWSVSMMLTLLQQERRTTDAFDSGEFLRTRGVGDGVLLLKYNLVPLTVFNHRQVTLGGGVKIPFGRTGLTSGGTLIAADMQPGTGAWDAVLWGHAFQGFYRTAPVGVFATASYRITGTNDRFSGNRGGYRFGNEFTSTLGINWTPTTRLEPTLALRYRSTRQDEFINDPLPNTGGRWLYLVPGIGVNLAEPLAVRFSGQLPLHRDLEGTQLTTDYTLSVSVFYTLSKKQKPLSIF